MAHTSERGAGWEIRRGFVDPDTAVRAGKELLELLDEGTCRYFEVMPYSPPGTEGITFCRLNAWSPWHFKEYPDTIQNDPVAMEPVHNLIDIHRKTSKLVRTTIPTANFNVYEVGGHTRRHRDRFKNEIFALGLLGVARAYIKDPVDDTWHQFDIEPGDGVHFVNPRQQRMRPLHRFVNVSNERRVSIVA